MSPSSPPSKPATGTARAPRWNATSTTPGAECSKVTRRATPSRNLPAHDRGAVGQRLELAEGDVARKIFHAAVGRRDELVGRHVFEALANVRGDLFRRLDREIAEVENAEHDLLALEVPQHAEVELGLRGFDRDLLG